MAKAAAFPTPGHDHSRCLDRGLKRARAAFDARGGRLTALREAVFRALAESHAALGAYDIIDRLRQRGRHVAPISVYRVLDALLEAGLVHRIESRNAYVACFGAHEDADPVLFLVCNRCGTVAESPETDLGAALKQAAGAAGFRPGDTVIEVSGLCRHCAA